MQEEHDLNSEEIQVDSSVITRPHSEVLNTKGMKVVGITKHKYNYL